MNQFDKLEKDVDLKELAALINNKINFSGAEIEGLVRAAQSSAMNRPIKATNKVTLDQEAAENLKVTRNDFMNALDGDIKLAFGVSAEDFELYIRNGILLWGQQIKDCWVGIIRERFIFVNVFIYLLCFKRNTSDSIDQIK